MSTVESSNGDKTGTYTGVSSDKNSSIKSSSEVAPNNFMTNICKSPKECETVGYAMLGSVIGLIALLLIVYYFGTLVGYIKGIVAMIKYFILYTMVIVVLGWFIQTLQYFYLWVQLFYWCGERVINPLIDRTVSSWYYYFVDGVNYIVYFFAELVFIVLLILCIGLLIILILPALAFISFMVTYIFSMMGEDCIDPINKPPTITPTSTMDKFKSMMPFGKKEPVKATEVGKNNITNGTPTGVVTAINNVRSVIPTAIPTTIPAVPAIPAIPAAAVSTATSILSSVPKPSKGTMGSMMSFGKSAKR
jgi:hypothetical protein